MNNIETEHITGSEVGEERGPGRPEIGPVVKVRLPEETLAQVDAAAEAEGVTRAAWLRGAVEATLS